MGVGLTAALVVTGGMLALSAQGKQDDIRRMQTFVDPATGRPLDYNSGNSDDALGVRGVAAPKRRTAPGELASTR